jgi:L-alanine-DL-glutamate epimerase-like enolase superfamily enzyme
VPCYQLLGGKFRDRIRAYCDTPQSRTPEEFGKRMKERLDLGFTFMKMDLGIGLVAREPNTISQPLGQSPRDTYNTMHFFTGIEVTPKGVQMMADYVAKVREIVGMEVPIAADHFGHIGVNSCIRLGRALEPYNLAWLEDMIPWQFPKQLREIKESISVPLLTGEDIYLKEPFIELLEQQAIDMIQPDLSTSGGLLETKKIGDLAMEYGVPMALHMAGSPIACMASVHCAAATENFLVMENHSVDIPWWDNLVNGSVRKPIIDKGFYTVPEGPGLGIGLNEDVFRQHLHPQKPGYFEPTDQWNRDQVNDRLWSQVRIGNPAKG